MSGAHSHGCGDVVEGDVAAADGSHPGGPPPHRQLGYLLSFVPPPGGETVESESVRDFPPAVVMRFAAAAWNAAVSAPHGCFTDGK